MTPESEPKLPIKVIEIRCPCGRGFSIRPKAWKVSKQCNQCMKTYIVRVYAGGAFSVMEIAVGSFVEVHTPENIFSDVTEGE